KEAVNLHPNPGRTFRRGGLVAEAQHRISKNGNKYGVFYIEDYSAKLELTLWSDDYVKFSNYLEAGMVIFLTGSFKQRYERFEFKVSGITLLESLMKACTKKLQIEAHPKYITEEFIEFIEKNVLSFPGRSSLKFCIHEPLSKMKIGMYSLEKGFEMNDEMAKYLQQKPELEILVELT
ncbi:MAG: OB-fold nucleic acid binding domain-containing protein, partial [Ginsengibacter sp.]